MLWLGGLFRFWRLRNRFGRLRSLGNIYGFIRYVRAARRMDDELREMNRIRQIMMQRLADDAAQAQGRMQ